MNISFQVMNRKFATEITGWRYDTPYEIYGYVEGDKNQTIDHFTTEENRFYAILSGDELIGFRSFGEDGRVSGGNYDDSHLDTGGGLHPDLTGKGLGPEIIMKGLLFGSRAFGKNRFRVTIADFNKRAKKACEKIGFSPTQRFARTSDGEHFTIFTIEINNREPLDRVLSNFTE
ncbi:MAG: GNAT family N-acetyltransferase [Opitutaceae bacterium]|nr:GNAT family N-acetyltransferase [Opitutaceae bacterium]